MGLKIKNVEVFSTNIKNLKSANQLKKMLAKIYPSSKVNFDLADCDKILRIEVQDQIDINNIIQIGHNIGIKIELLES